MATCASWITKRNTKGLRDGWSPDRQWARGAAGRLIVVCVSIGMPTHPRLSRTSNENTVAVVRCKCIEDDVNHVYYAD